jgi:hypothetical protein
MPRIFEVDNDFHLPEVECICPKCGKVHIKRMTPPRITPRIYCRACKWWVNQLSDIHDLSMSEPHGVGYR